MFLKPFEIDGQLKVAEIVLRDYRTAFVFRKYGLGYCCGGNWPLSVACRAAGVDESEVTEALEESIRCRSQSNQVDYHSWDLDFLADYIVNVHHHCLKKSLPETAEMLAAFIAEHVDRFPYLEELGMHFNRLVEELESSIKTEEEVVFPYIKQVAHAVRHREPYTSLFIRTFRKPVELTIARGQKTVEEILLVIREITNTYVVPENVCTSHKVIIQQLKDLDMEIIQHIYLEQSVLYPRVEETIRNLEL